MEREFVLLGLAYEERICTTGFSLWRENLYYWFYLMEREFVILVLEHMEREFILLILACGKRICTSGFSLCIENLYYRI